MKETPLSSALGDLGVEKRGAYMESGIRFARDLKKKQKTFLSVLGGKKNQIKLLLEWDLHPQNGRAASILPRCRPPR